MSEMSRKTDVEVLNAWIETQPTEFKRNPMASMMLLLNCSFSTIAMIFGGKAPGKGIRRTIELATGIPEDTFFPMVKKNTVKSKRNAAYL